jgi:aldehyde dehydrogenase (NAD(P)+)
MEALVMVAEHKSVHIPSATSRAELDQMLARLRAAAPGWAKSPIDDRLQLLRQFLSGYLEIAEDSVLAGLAAKGIDPSTPLASEEWLAGPVVVVRNLRLLIETLENVRAGRPTLNAERIETLPDGRVRVQVFPPAVWDKLTMPGFTAEVWMKPGVSAADVTARAAHHYKTPQGERKPAVSLVLGAGNVASIPPTDVIYKMFAEGKVCILKMNPVNAHVGPFVERAFRAAIDRGLLAVCYGGPEVGAYLVEHPEVDEIHITGSDKTHDMMLWGPPGPEREERKRKKEPKLKKEISSELGNVSPVIVVPGPYTDAELAFQGESIAAAITNNASFNCIAAKLLVGAAGWDGRLKLRNALAETLKDVPVRKAYYPGAEQRWRELVESHPHVQRIGEERPGALQWAIISELDASNRDEKCFQMEPWCSLISETTVGSADPVAFLDAAVKFCNEEVWGTLSATIVVHPASLRDPRVAAALDRAVRELRYGTVCINHWPALGFVFGTTPWGGHPSSTLEDIQSGRGWVHNTFLLNDDDIEKCVIRGPLVSRPKPPWFPTHKTADRLAKRLLRFEGAPSLAKLPGLIWNALKG